MLTEICAELHNYFCSDADKHIGSFKISGGKIAPLDFLIEGQYFRIVGSALNDGVYQYPAATLADEAFEGAIWAMRVPPSLIAIASDIEKYCNENPASAYTSESFGSYSYTKKNDTSWQKVFKHRLNRYRRIMI